MTKISNYKVRHQKTRIYYNADTYIRKLFTNMLLSIHNLYKIQRFLKLSLLQSIKPLKTKSKLMFDWA